MKIMGRLRRYIDRIILSLCVFLFSAMTAIGFYQIASRYIFNSPSTKSEELISYMFAWMSLLAAAYIFGKKEHMKMVFFVEKLPIKTQKILQILCEIIILLFAIFVLIKGGISITTLTMTQITPALKIPMGYIYCVIPVSGVIIAIYSVLNVKDILKNMREEKR